MPSQTVRQVTIEAKHLRPRHEHASLRPDSLAAFADALHNRLTVLCAPAGYGKTTMTAAALDHCGHAASWYKLDVLDQDPFAFLASMVRAVRREHPEFGDGLLAELEAGPVVDLPIEALAARFCAECDQRLHADLHLVLDDYHEAAESAAMNGVLDYLLENCPATLHFVVLTRYEPAFRMEKLRLAGHVCRLPRETLLFDEEQVGVILARRSGRQQKPDDIRRLHVLTEGWPASVVLAGMALSWVGVDSLGDVLSDPRLRGDVFSYLAEQVFRRQTEDVQRFLLETCCLEHVTAPLAESLCGSARAARHLSYLGRNHIFTFDAEKEGAYRYHNLLRDFLRQRFVQEDGGAAFHDLQRRTAAALEHSGDRAAAVELLLNANEPDLALGVVSRGGEAELERRPSEQLRMWVERLSPHADNGDPWALIISGVLAARDGEFPAALEYLRLATRALEDARDVEGLYQALSILEWAEFWSGDSAASMTTCEKALAHARQDSQRLHTLLGLLSAAVDMKQWEKVAEASRRADAYLEHASPEDEARAQALKAHAAYYQGDMLGAHRLIVTSERHGGRGAQAAAALNMRGVVETALGDYEAAERHLALATSTAEHFGHASTSYMIEDSFACLRGALGDIDACISTLETLSSEGVHAQESSLQAYSLCHLGTAYRRSGALERSVDPTERALALVSVDRDPYLALNAAANLTFSECLLGRGHHDRLVDISRDAAGRGLRFVEFKTQLFLAVLHHEEGNLQPAVEMLVSCIPEQLRLGHVNLVAQELVPRPELVASLLRKRCMTNLGPMLIGALGRHWLFFECAEVLGDTAPRQTATWLSQLGSGGAIAQLGIAGSALAGPVSSRPCATGSLKLLTKREYQVLELMENGLQNDEIAANLFVSIATVKTHVNHILRKLEQRTRVGAILEFQRERRRSRGRNRP
jgi:ATP/maltotriose-dependent transcriptional regulator MalT